MRQIALSTSSVYPLKTRSAFRAAAELGFDGVEVMITPESDSKTFASLRALEKEFSVPVLSIHAPTLLVCSFVWGVHPSRKLEKAIALSEGLGVDTIVIHPPMRFNRYARNFFQSIQTAQSQTKIKLAIENMFPWNIAGHGIVPYYPRYADITRTVKYLTLDFSHAALSGLETVDFAEKYADKIQMIHLCDGSIHHHTHHDRSFDEHKVPGEGEMPIRETFQKLSKQGWSGRTTLEINTRSQHGYENKLLPLRNSLEFFRSLPE